MKCVNVLTFIYAVVCLQFVYAQKSARKFKVNDTGDDDTEVPDFLTTARYLSVSINTKEGPTVSSTKGDLIEDATSFVPNWEQVYNFTHLDDPVSAETPVLNKRKSVKSEYEEEDKSRNISLVHLNHTSTQEPVLISSNGTTLNESTPPSMYPLIADLGRIDYPYNDESTTDKLNPSTENTESTTENSKFQLYSSKIFLKNKSVQESDDGSNFKLKKDNIKDQNKEKNYAMEKTSNKESLEINSNPTEMNEFTQSENRGTINSAMLETMDDEISKNENMNKINEGKAKAVDSSEFNSPKNNEVWKNSVLPSTAMNENKNEASTSSAETKAVTESTTENSKLENQDHVKGYSANTIFRKNESTQKDDVKSTNSKLEESRKVVKLLSEIESHTTKTEIENKPTDRNETLESNNYSTKTNESSQELRDTSNTKMKENVTKPEERIANGSKPIDDEIKEKENMKKIEVARATTIKTTKALDSSQYNSFENNQVWKAFGLTSTSMKMVTGNFEVTTIFTKNTSPIISNMFETSSILDLNKNMEKSSFGIDEVNIHNTEVTTTPIADLSATISATDLEDNKNESYSKIEGIIHSNTGVTDTTYMTSISKSTASTLQEQNMDEMRSYFDDNTETPTSTIGPSEESSGLEEKTSSDQSPRFDLNENMEKIPFATTPIAEYEMLSYSDVNTEIPTSTIGSSEETSSLEEKTSYYDQSLVEVSSNIESSKTYEKMIITTDDDNAKNTETTTISHNSKTEQNTVKYPDYSSDYETKLTTSEIKSSIPSEDSTTAYSTIPTVETITETLSTSSPPNTQISNKVTKSETTTQLILSPKLPASTIQSETSSMTTFSSQMAITTDIPVITEKLTEAAGLTTVITAISTEDMPHACTGIEISDYELGTGDTWINIYWELNSMPNNRCNLKINTTCVSEDERFEEIVSYQSTLSTVEDDQPASYLRNLSEFTNYNCTGILYANIPYQFDLSVKTFRVTTKKAAPSSIEFNITDVTDTSFMIEWQRPRKINGNFKGYYISIQKQSLHYIREDCTEEPDQKTIKLDEIDDVSFNFTTAKPNNRYKVQVVAENDVGNSTGIIRTFITDNSTSTEPLNVTSILHIHTNHCGKDAYNATLELNWELPCDTNGELMGFEIKIREKIYLGNKLNNTSNTRTYKISKRSNVKDLNYQIIVEKLNASCVYEFTIKAITGNDILGLAAKGMSNRTMDGCPSKPCKIVVHPQPSSFSLEWMQPNEYFGEILNYEVTVTESGPKHQLSKDETCPAYPELIINETTNETHFMIDEIQPNFAYKYTILAKTSAGRGEASDSTEIVALPKESEPIRNLQLTKMDEIITENKYEYKIRIDFQEPCNTNGYFRHYTIEEKGRRPGYPEVYDVINVNRTSYERILRRPEYQYEFEITVVTQHDLRSPVARKKVTTNAAIPMLDRKKINCSVDGDAPTVVKVVLQRGILNEDNGEIRHYAIYVFEGELKNSSLPSSGICNPTCPLVNRTTYPFINKASIHQITPENWNPFLVKSDFTITIGDADDCSDEKLCTSLAEDTNYIVVLRGSTRNTYRDVFISIKTGVIPTSASLIVIPILILIVILVFVGSYLYIKRTKFVTIFRSIPETPIEEEPSTRRHIVPVKQFISYYNKILSDPTILRKQYEEIDEETKKYKEENVHTTFALKPENKRKNRYTNILPYDEFRVKLNMDEDDEISSDYINASYVNGITGEVEYIATQGPLEHTCKDFWKMVIQENITVIVMVSQFVEKEKEKCFKYFPKNHENMLISDDIEVKCLTELQFDTYCVRTLLIKKDIRHYSVVHMQYLDWPDFGCPSGTYNMISFCKEVRDRIQIERGLMAVHCSAGVGRTGTLISLDILLQAMKREKEISVFECVMDLRKQRTHMVQTEKQYVYIHTCLKDILEDSSLYSFDDLKETDEHAYENIKNLKKSVKVNQKTKDIESAF